MPEAGKYSTEISSRLVIYQPGSAIIWNKLSKNKPSAKKGSYICGWNHWMMLLSLSYCYQDQGSETFLTGCFLEGRSPLQSEWWASSLHC